MLSHFIIQPSSVPNVRVRGKPPWHDGNHSGWAARSAVAVEIELDPCSSVPYYSAPRE
jgi:hypothetical protein